MSVITGEAVPSVRDMEDKVVVEECLKVLRELFKEQVKLSHFTFVTPWTEILRVTYTFYLG